MKCIGLLLVMTSLSLGATQGVTAQHRPTPRSCPADPALSKLVAASDDVVVGTMIFAADELGRQAALPSPNYIDIAVTIDRAVKGTMSGQAVIRFYAKDAIYKPGNAAMAALAGKPALFFLQQVDGAERGLYFAGNTPRALQPASSDNIALAEAEASRQSGILNGWRPDPNLPHYREVQEIIAHLGHVRGRAQQALFDRVIALGDSAVPAIVAQMDDRRRLLDQQITLKNTAGDAFEPQRFYGPEQVVDALDAILNQITGESFGSIENGGSNRERTSAVAGWRVYAATRRCM